VGALTKRAVTTAVAIPLLLFVTFWDLTFAFESLAVLGLAVALFEFLNLAGERGMKPLRVEGMLALLFMLLPWLLKPMVHWEGREGFLAGLMLLTLTFLWSRRPMKEMAVSVSVTFFGAAYFGILGHYFFRLRDLPDGSWHLLFLFAATWAYDTGGYFVGRRWGRHRLAPLASPQKSWEGCIGGFFLALLGLFLLWKYVPFYAANYAPTDILVLAVLLSVFGQLGDLVESMMKRSLLAKDSGSLLPGHGGVFDRIDSLLFNAPALYYYLMVIK
jgi:phosphatidate cytidylyltransferase